MKWEEMVFKKLKSNFGIWKTSVNILLSIWHFLWIIKTFHCLKNVRIRNFSGPYFPAFGLNLHAVSMFLIWQFYDNKISIHRAISVIYCRKRIYLFFFFTLFGMPQKWHGLFNFVRIIKAYCKSYISVLNTIILKDQTNIFTKLHVLL